MVSFTSSHLVAESFDLLSNYVSSFGYAISAWHLFIILRNIQALNIPSNTTNMMKKIYLMLLLTSFMYGCSTLSKTQIKAVNFFATTSKNFSAYPSKIMTGLADIRVKRGVYYANSLDNPRLHIQELDSIYSFKKENYAISAKVNITFQNH